MASSATRSSGPGRWLSGHFTVCLAVYDTRRGQAEGCEADKILGFYPPSAPPAMQSSIVGLAHAVTMFAGTFNKVGAAACAAPSSQRMTRRGHRGERRGGEGRYRRS
jgi:hypothetical protein